jgi:TorA-specific chaperone
LNSALYLHLLKTLCRVFWGPDLSLCQEILSGEFVKLIQDSAVYFRIDLSVVVQTVNCLADEYKDPEALRTDLSDGYIALFINDISGIPAPLYQSCYQKSNSRLMGPPAFDMKNRLKNHGLSISLPGNEPADHLCIELEYIFYLLNRGLSESNSESIREAVQFCGESMADWVHQFCERVIGDGRFVFYAVAAELLSVTVRSLAENTIFQQCT